MQGVNLSPDEASEAVCIPWLVAPYPSLKPATEGLGSHCITLAHSSFSFSTFKDPIITLGSPDDHEFLESDDVLHNKPIINLLISLAEHLHSFWGLRC